MERKKIKLNIILFLILICFSAYSMHIVEGYLPVDWSVIWYLVSAPFVIVGYRTIRKRVVNEPKFRIILGIAGAFVFVLSALKLPSVAGSSSHLTGTSLGAIVIGPAAMALIGVIVLLFQALLLAHGGITTLGANVFSMAIVGPWIAFSIYIIGKKLKINTYLVIFIAAFAGDMVTYITTSMQLAAAYPDGVSGFMGAAFKFLSVFAVTQLPLAVLEGLITVWAVRVIKSQGVEPLAVCAIPVNKTNV